MAFADFMFCRLISFLCSDTLRLHSFYYPISLVSRTISKPTKKPKILFQILFEQSTDYSTVCLPINFLLRFLHSWDNFSLVSCNLKRFTTKIRTLISYAAKIVDNYMYSEQKLQLVFFKLRTLNSASKK